MRGRGRAGAAWAALVVVVGLGAGTGAGAFVGSVIAHNAERVMDHRTATARSAVVAEVRRYLDTLRTVAAALGGEELITPARFQATTAPLVDARLVGATSISYVITATDGEVARAEASWRGAGVTGLTLHPVATDPVHYFAVLLRSLDGGHLTPTGRDIAQVPEASAALAAARRNGAPAISDPYVLLRDRTLPASRQQLSFVLATPVYGPAAGAFRGWVLMGMHGQDFVNGVVREVTDGEVDTALYASNRAGTPVAVAVLDTTAHPTLFREAQITVADHRWTLRTAAPASALVGAARVLPAGTTVALAGAGLLLAGLVWVLVTGRERALARVATATADLSQAEANARSQASLLQAILDALTEGVSVIDGTGRIQLRNHAATQILGTGHGAESLDDWRGHQVMYRADGQTPFPVDELPLALALRGQTTDDVEIMIRGPEHPEGVLISVSGRPLADVGGAPGAMAVYRDITAIRAHEVDLTTFAGVVAHDLKAPLATIASYGELVSEELSERLPGEDGDDARQFHSRVLASVHRAGALIDDLLAFTTARDARLHVSTVDLDTLVERVAIERTEHLAPDTPWPRISVGTLGKVEADPGMLHRVLDNLLSNAIKYVRPGESADVKITAEPTDPPERVRITVADRGIGIPDTDKRRVFELFQRAHLGAGYSGTGLGLAICRRIVQRHGGEITVADNPGGGTRIEILLPMHAAAPAHRRRADA